jgi:hypothetical protein
MEEIKEKQALKRSRLMAKPPKARKPRVATKKVSKKATAPKKPKSKTQAQLKKELDKVFSIFIRQKYADTSTGIVKCYTCSTYKHWKEIQNGHWIPRNVLATRFSEDNCRPQCVGCNMFQKGMPDVFAVNLIRDGVDIVALQKSRYFTLKLDRIWYTEKINYYKAKIHELS